MTGIVERLSAAEDLRLDAKAFRENTVYDSEGNPIRLIANAERMERGADTIEGLLAALERARGSVQSAILRQDIGTMGRQIDESILAQIDAAIAKAKAS